MMGMNRKTMLASAGVLLVVAVVVWNAASVPPSAANDPSQGAAAAAEPRPVTPEEKEATAAAIRGSLAKSQPKESGAVEGVPETPVILLPKVVSYKPTPNDSNIATHWYKDASRSAKLAGERGD
jgi:hypothetical protein